MLKLNGKKWSAVALVVIALYGAASALSAAVGCNICTQVLTAYKASLPAGELVEVSGTAIVSGTELPITGVVVSDTAAE